VRLVVFGSRSWTDEFMVGVVLQGFLFVSQAIGEKLTVIDGMAPGADSIAGAWYGVAADGIHAMHKDVQHERYAADWNRYGRAAGVIRNGVMLAEAKPDHAVGFVDGLLPDGRPNSRGSKDMYVRLVNAGVPTYLVLRSRP
jgi:hypothetical protein